MKQEYKEILIRDLCCRLPYGVKASYYGADEECETWDEVDGIAFCYVEIGQYSLPIERIKPYLFPMSSMTDEQKNEYQYITERWMNDSSYSISDSIDWLNKNHFDYRGLIPMGLALDATNLNIY